MTSARLFYIGLELRYDDVFVAWESIWAAEVVTSRCFVDFISLALVELYREVIIDNSTI